jgi:hypothetical protein
MSVRGAKMVTALSQKINLQATLLTISEATPDISIKHFFLGVIDTKQINWNLLFILFIGFEKKNTHTQT